MGSLGRTTCKVHSIFAPSRKDSNVCTSAKEYLRAHSLNIYTVNTNQKSWKKKCLFKILQRQKIYTLYFYTVCKSL